MANKNTRKKNQNKQGTNVARTAQQPMDKEERKKKKARRSAANQQNRRQRRSLIEYFKGVRLEMKKVVWPTRKELGSYTVVVVGVCAFFALMFWAVDSGFLLALKGLLGINM